MNREMRGDMNLDNIWGVGLPLICAVVIAIAVLSNTLLCKVQPRLDGIRLSDRWARPGTACLVCSTAALQHGALQHRS